MDVMTNFKVEAKPHLLRFTKVGCMPAHETNYTGISSSLCSSAVELAEIGVVLTPITEAWLGHMHVHHRCHRLFGEPSLSPLFLSDVTACWLVNMASLEACTAEEASDGFVVSS